ncbi:uncharacterized protein [Watersipora subatra]|uniref:uncharacterized protein n=1 Tax=Watersipora subatra TaxID=2589382 RepID=UPI00355B4B62
MFQLTVLLYTLLAVLQFCEGIKYQGCYSDEDGFEDLQDVNPLGHVNDVQECVNLCTFKAYKFAGLRDKACYCGDKFENFCKIDDTFCNKACPGNGQQKCGSSEMYSIYSTNYLGCWKDSPTRDMRNFNSMPFYKATLQECVRLCHEKGFKYAGAQYYLHCYCDNRFGTYSELDKSSCSTRCRGNFQQNCGGVFANSVFDTQI